MYLLSFPRFWTLSIEFLFWSILNGVTLKTSHYPITVQIWSHVKRSLLLRNFLITVVRTRTIKKIRNECEVVVNPFITPWDKPFVEKRHGNVRSVSMDYTVIKQRDLRSFYLLSTRNHFTLKYLMADLGGQEIMVQRSLWRNQCNHIFKISVAVKQYEDCFLFDSGPRVFH